MKFEFVKQDDVKVTGLNGKKVKKIEQQKKVAHSLFWVHL